MLEIRKKELNLSIIVSIIYAILGFIIVANPVTTLNIVSYTVSISAIIYGIVITIINVANFKEEGNLLFGILIHPHESISLECINLIYGSMSAS